MADLGWKLPIAVHSDATASIGIARRKGPGKIRHLDVTDLWIQDKVKSKQVVLNRVLGADNPTDVFTKYVKPSNIQTALSAIHMVRMTGRPACAPKVMGA